MKDKQEQIEGMAKDLEEAKCLAIGTVGSMNNGFGGWYGAYMYKKGYRKASDVIDEFVERLRKRFEQTETIANSLHGRKNSEIDSIIKIIAEEMKKETEE